MNFSSPFRAALLALGLLAGTVAGTAGPPCSLQPPTDLQCEYLQEPLGLDVRKPRLSWRLEAANPDGRGQRQSAYHVLVATDRTLLEKDHGDLWDTAMVPSSQSQLIEYAGRPLSSDLACWWKVRVRDEKGQYSDWSQPAHWTAGLLGTNDWTAKWIGTDLVFERPPGSPPADNTLPDPWLRKRFKLDVAPKRAVMHVASVGYHELYVNGQKAGDAVLAPCATDHTKRARYVTYDITSLLRPGENVVGLWLGFSWSIFPPYRTADKPASPIVIAQADLTLPDGNRARWVTDESWCWHPSPNTTLGVWDFMHFGGERYDATREMTNWCEVSVRDENWKPVKVFAPKLALSAQKVEPNRLVKSIHPISIREVRPGVWRADMGVNFAGWIEADVRGQPGDPIQFKLSERFEQEMTHQLHSTYVIGPTGKGTFRNRFNYGVGRWITIEGLSQKPEPSDIRGWLVRTAYTPALEFSCANDLLNRVCDTTLWTYETLSLGGYVVDCAQRERMGYGGDAHATTATGLDAFHTAALYSKWAEDWRDVQGTSASWGAARAENEAGASRKIEPGNLPYTAPTYWGGGGPGWSGYCVTLPWELYRRLGDRRILEQMLPTIQAWLAFLETRQRDNLLRRWGGEWDFLGDWLWPGAQGVNGDTRETLFFNNCYWIYNLQTAARIADALAQPAQAKAWRGRAEEVRAAVHKEFFNAAEDSYANGLQAYLSLALLTDVPPENLRLAVAKRLEEEILVKRKGHFWGGITGGSFIVRQLIESDRPDLMFTMATQEDYPGWGDMLKRGATTMWEDWEGKLSLCHSSYLHIGAWFVEGLAGIRPGPNGEGYQDFILKPGFWPDCPMDWMRCRFDSPCGAIRSDWRKTAAGLNLRIEVPANTDATLFVPGPLNAVVTEQGRSIDRVAGVVSLGNLNGHPVLRLGPGRYQFDVR